MLACVPKDQANIAVCEISLESTVKEALKNPMFKVGTWPKEAWWETLASDELNFFVLEALKHNPGYLSAKAQVLVLKEEAKVVYANLFPTLSLDATSFIASLGKDTGLNPAFELPRHIHPTTVFFNFNYEFDFWGKNKQKFEAAVGQIKTQEALFEQSKLMLSVAVSQTYFDLQALTEEKEIYEALLNDQRRLFDLVKLQLENGITNEIELNTVEQNLIEIEKNIQILDEQIALGNHALQQLIGKQVKENLVISPIKISEAKTFDLPEFIGSDLIARRPDIMAKIWQVRSAASLVGVAKTEFLPNINLEAGGGVFNFHFNDLFKRSSLAGFLLPSFELPIFTAGKLTANLRAKLASYDQTIQEYNGVILSAIQQVSDQVTIFKSLTNRIKDQERTVQLAEKNMKLSALRVNVGLDPLTKYLQASSLFKQAKAELIELKRAQILTRIDLIKALGGGYQTDEIDPSLCVNK